MVFGSRPRLGFAQRRTMVLGDWMTIDERLEKLTERHEALTQSVELLRIAQEETDRRSKETEKRFQETDKKFRQTADLFQQTDGFINELARIARSHENRLDDLERSNPKQQPL